MQRPFLPLLMLLSAPGFAQTSYTPSREEASVPTYVNAEVVRVDRAAGTLTIRSESGDTVLTADRHALPGVTGLKAGDKVLVAYEVLVDEDGRARRLVTYLQPASPTSGEPGPPVAVASAVSAGSTVRVLSTDSVNRASLRAGAGTSTTTIRRTGLAGPAGAPTATPGAVGQTGADGNAGQPTGGLPFIGSGIAVPSVGGGTSPFGNSVPSVPTPSPVFNAVLPPATAKAPLNEDEVGAMRAYGERDLDGAAMVLAMVANDIDVAWSRFKVACLSGFIPETAPNREWFLLLDGRVRTSTDDQCRAMQTQLQGQAAGFDQQLGITRDAARRADVLPGRIRETLERHRIDR